MQAAWSHLRAMGVGAKEASRLLCGCELHQESALAAYRRMETLGVCPLIAIGDFFDIVQDDCYDAVVGNPPYIRFHEFAGNQRSKALALCRERGVELSALTSSWAPFVVLCAKALRVGGNLGLVLPAELLTVNYASPVRKFLLDLFPFVEITLFGERVFPEAQEEVVILIARGYGTGSCHEIMVRHAPTIGDLESTPVFQAPVSTDGSRWSELLLASAQRSPAEPAVDGFETLGTWGNVSLGAVTGNNAYFALSESAIRDWGLSADDYRALVPPGSGHLRLLAYGMGEHESSLLKGARAYLFYPRPDADLSPAALTYIAYGEEQGINQAYKCRKRTPWWRVPIPQQPADALFTYMNADTPQLCANTFGGLHLNSVHGVRFYSDRREMGMRLLPIAAFNSYTALSAELEGRPYGGGVLKMEPREASRLLVPSIEVLETAEVRLRDVYAQVRELLMEGKRAAAMRLVDEVVLLETGCLSQEHLQDVCASLAFLQDRRRNRARTKGGASSDRHTG